MSNGSDFALGYLVGEQLGRAPWEAAQELHAKNMAREDRRAAFETEQTLAIALQSIETLKAQVANLTRKLALEQCASEGLAAMVDAYKAENPASQWAKGTGIRYDEGGEKTVGRIKVYEPAFRKKAAELGISIPDRYLD